MSIICFWMFEVLKCLYVQNITNYFWLQTGSLTCLLLECCCWVSWWCCLGLKLVSSCWCFLILLLVSIVAHEFCFSSEVVNIDCLFSQYVRVFDFLVNINHVIRLVYFHISLLMTSAHLTFKTGYFSLFVNRLHHWNLDYGKVSLYILCFSIIPS